MCWVQGWSEEGMRVGWSKEGKREWKRCSNSVLRWTEAPRWEGLGTSRQRNMCSIEEMWNCVVYLRSHHDNELWCGGRHETWSWTARYMQTTSPKPHWALWTLLWSSWEAMIVLYAWRTLSDLGSEKVTQGQGMGWTGKQSRWAF